MRILFVHSWLILLYAAARFWQLTDACLWFDEIFSVHAAEHPWGDILNFVALDLIHPPLFYVLLKFWIAAGGESLFWLRLFPVVFSLIAVFPFLRLCNELKIGKWTRLLALFLFAVNGSLIKYSQEVRMYAPLMCLSLFSMWLFARYFVKGKSFVPLVIVNVLMVYTHYFGWFVVVTEVALILWFQRIKWRRMAVMLGVVFATFLPWLIAVFMASRGGSELGQNIGWMSRPGLREIGIFVLDLIEPFYSQAASAEPESVYRVSIPILLIVVTSFFAYLTGWKNRTEDEKRSVWLLLTFIKLPVVIAFAGSWLLPYSVWGTRHLIVVFAPLAIYTAVAASDLSNRKLRTGLVSLVLLFSGYAFFLQTARPTQTYSWCAFGPLTSQIRAVEPTKIYVLEDLVAYHVWFATQIYPSAGIVKLTNVEGIVEDNAFFLPRGFEAVTKIDLNQLNAKQLWLMYRANVSDADSPPLSTMHSLGYEIVDERMFEANDSKVFATFFVNHTFGLTTEQALSAMNSDCWSHGRPDCVDYAGFLTEQFHRGDTSLLAPLVQEGLESDNALATVFGMFFGQMLENETHTFLSQLMDRTKSEQAELCDLAIGGDGGGHGIEWNHRVKEKLLRITNESSHRLHGPANICIERLEKAKARP